jgi:hypothetical protein
MQRIRLPAMGLRSRFAILEEVIAVLLVSHGARGFLDRTDQTQGITGLFNPGDRDQVEVAMQGAVDGESITVTAGNLNQHRINGDVGGGARGRGIEKALAHGSLSNGHHRCRDRAVACRIEDDGIDPNRLSPVGIGIPAEAEIATIRIRGFDGTIDPD